MCIKLHLESVYGIEQKVYNDIVGYWSRIKNCKDVERNKNAQGFHF